MRAVGNPAERFERARQRTYSVAGLVIPRRVTHIFVLAVGSAALLAIVAAAIWVGGSVAENAGSLAAMERRKAVMWEILRLAQDAETGERGYLLTGERAYLKPYLEAVAALPEQRRKLRELIGGNLTLEAQADTLDQALDQRLDDLASTVALQEQGDNEGAMARLHTNAGLAAMEKIRQTIATMVAAEDSRFVLLGQGSRGSGRMLIWGNVAAAALLAALAVIAIYIVRRDTASLEKARSDLMRLNASLTGVVDKRTFDLRAANEEIQRFAYIVSHDLRSPLVNVMGFTSELEASLAAFGRQIERLERDAPDLVDDEAQTAIREDVPEAIGFIRSATAKMDRLINAILRLSRDGRRVLTAELVETRDIFANAIASFHFQLESAGVTAVIEGDPPAITTDRLALEQIIGNLLDNAVKYLDSSRPGHITLSGRDAGGFVELAIKDNGRGIDEKDHERIFDLFRRSGIQDTPGEGLGLAFVRAAVRRLGGAITLKSKPGRGTTFTLVMPKTLPQSDGNPS